MAPTPTSATPRLHSRRELLAMLGGLGAAVVVAGCSGDGGGSSASRASSSQGSATTGASPSTTTTTTAGATAAVATVARIPEETAGPYPADGSNGPNVLSQSGVVRSDIRGSFGGSSTVAAGVPLTVALTLVDVDQGGVPLDGGTVYLWHCDADGAYSMYSLASGENYLRGVQVAGSDGAVTFTTIFPAAYSGRWPHIHFQVFPDVAAATGGGSRLVTSQLALPADVCSAVFATSGYESSVTNMARTSLDADMVFSDGHDLQLASVTGDPTSGYVARLTVGV